MRSILFEHRNNIPTAVVFSGSEQANGQWASIFPKSFIYTSIDEDVLTAIVRRQDELAKNAPPGVSPHLTLIFDDIDAKEMHSPLIKKLYTQGRHWNIGIFVLVQYYTMLPSIARNNSNIIAVTNTEGADRGKIFKTFFSGTFDNQQEFDVSMAEYCSDWGLLVLDKRFPSSRAKDKLKWVKVSRITQPFTVGNREYWAMDELFGLPEESTKINWDDYKAQLAKRHKQSQASTSTDHITGYEPIIRLDENGNAL